MQGGTATSDQVEVPAPRPRLLERLRLWFEQTFVGRCIERTIELRPFDRALALASRSFIALLPLGMVATSLGPSSNSGGFAQAVVDRFGLQGEAAKQVKSFFAPPQQVRGGTTILGAVVLVYSVVGFARLLGRLYEGAWRLPPSGLKGAVRGLGWVAATAAYVAFILPLRNGIEHHTGPVLGRIAIVITSCAVWWLTPYILLGGRISRRSLVPTAVLTTLCMGIAGVLSGVYMPRSIANSGAHYGPVGVAFALVSWLISISLVVLVCASVGAVAGERWFSPGRDAAEVAPGAGTATVAGPVRRKHLTLADRIERFNIWRAIRLLVAADILLIFLAAFWIHLVEPSTFPNYGISLWWSVVTVGTVGYGDVVPHSVAGRIAGATTIILTLALIPTITSLVVSALVEHRTRARHAGDSITLEEIARRLTAIEARLSAEQGDEP